MNTRLLLIILLFAVDGLPISRDAGAAQAGEGLHPRRPIEHGRAGRRGPRRQGLQRRQGHAQRPAQRSGQGAARQAPQRPRRASGRSATTSGFATSARSRPLLAGPLAMGFSVYGDKHHFGPELQFGHVLGDHFDNQVLLIKTAWGGKSLYKDFRPPSSGGEVGPYYTKMIADVRTALENLKTEFPGYNDQGYELAGFVWYQGWNDGVDPKKAVPEYEQNLVNLINDVRKEFKAPKLPFVIGELTGPWVQAPGRMGHAPEGSGRCRGQARVQGERALRRNARLRPAGRRSRPTPATGITSSATPKRTSWSAMLSARGWSSCSRRQPQGSAEPAKPTSHTDRQDRRLDRPRG